MLGMTFLNKQPITKLEIKMAAPMVMIANFSTNISSQDLIKGMLLLDH